MRTSENIEKAARRFQLNIVGIVAIEPNDPVPSGTKCIVLFGPNEPGFWEYFTNQPEWGDGKAEPMDRWSDRVITSLASIIGGQSVLPFQGPPYAPFFSWALRSGYSWQSPVSLLVHHTAGLFVSFRGAIALPYELEPSSTRTSPCDLCNDRACIGACPVGALNDRGYDLAKCHKFLDTESGKDCMRNGCAVRRSCPISQSFGRRAVQSAYHMRAFHP